MDNESMRTAYVAIRTVVLAFAGLVYPLMFISQVDGYMMHFQPAEIVAVYASGWLVYVFMGLVFGSLAVGVAATISPGIGCSREFLKGATAAWISISFVLIALLVDIKISADAKELALSTWLRQSRWALVIVAVFGAAWWAWFRGWPVALAQLSKVATALGLVVAVAAVLVIPKDATPHFAPSHANLPLKEAVSAPSIVLLSIDALAASHMSLYGYKRTTTPRLDELARQASVFQNFYANSNWTIPSVTSFISGVRPWTHRAMHPNARPDPQIADNGLVAQLRLQGYETLAVATNNNASPILNRSDRWLDAAAYGRVATWWQPIAEHYWLFLALGDPLMQRAVSTLYYLAVAAGLQTPAGHFNPELALSSARRLVEGRRNAGPTFLWVHLLPPHDPYATPAPFVGRFDSRPTGRSQFDSSPPLHFAAAIDSNFPDQYVSRYDESITYVDYHVGQFIDWLKQQGLFEDSILVVTADHGESFSHQYGSHGGPMLYEDLIHIPLIIKGPRQRSARRINEVAEQIDLMPTILELAGIPGGAQMEGRSLVPLMHGLPTDERAVFAMNFEQSPRCGDLDTGTVAMIQGRWKYVHYRGHMRYPLMPPIADTLFDIYVDRGERINLIGTYPEIAERMRMTIENQLRAHGRRSC